MKIGWERRSVSFLPVEVTFSFREVLVMEAVATAVLDEKERERQEQIKKLQNETCFIGHPFGVGVMNFKFMMGQITGYGYDIHLY
jgi:hypothetical protein